MAVDEDLADTPKRRVAREATPNRRGGQSEEGERQRVREVQEGRLWKAARGWGRAAARESLETVNDAMLDRNSGDGDDEGPLPDDSAGCLPAFTIADS